MIDIHCHILPNVDDGPSNYFDVIEMANQAVMTGITHLFATPHHMNGRYENTKTEILAGVRSLNQILQNEKIPLSVHCGQELRIHREIFHTLDLNEVLTLDNQGKYLLVELPSKEIPDYTLDVIYELLLKGITPILVHPERNMMFHENPSLLFELVQVGALTQLTSGSIIGHFGKKIKNFSEKMMEHHLAHFVANDAHNIHSRGFFLQEAYEVIIRKFGVKQSAYFNNNAELLLNGEKFQREEPMRIRNKFLAFFENTFGN
ncbi:tyrosine-protein phosphatase [Bacillus massilinigeriensis]|uniref:tyrosine-protein phosphatase n=1 Tax=Bacillus massilionigeriensis TaxID=1805475 RepID=UPI00096B43D9|nr:CpsB/CapC family capsule biosynthesis tyrosine phosphatase [Bacillus massilionigeriensis]